MKVTGTTVWAEDIEGGVALRFTTTGDVAELQSRLQRMAQMHNRQAADRRGRGPHEHGMHGHPEHAMMGGPAMQAKARAENLEDGGRLVFTPRDPEQLADLQQALRTHAEKMSSGRCPMMSKHASAGANEPPAPVANESRDR